MEIKSFNYILKDYNPKGDIFDKWIYYSRNLKLVDSQKLIYLRSTDGKDSKLNVSDINTIVFSYKINGLECDKNKYAEPGQIGHIIDVLSTLGCAIYINKYIDSVKLNKKPEEIPLRFDNVTFNLDADFAKLPKINTDVYVVIYFNGIQNRMLYMNINLLDMNTLESYVTSSHIKFDIQQKIKKPKF